MNDCVSPKNIFHVLDRGRIEPFIWGIEGLDWFGDSQEVTNITEASDSASQRRILVSGSHLFAAVEHVWQTLEGTFIGYQSQSAAERFLQKGWSTADLAAGWALMIIEAVRGDEFYVCTRFRPDAEALARHFYKTWWEKPENF